MQVDMLRTTLVLGQRVLWLMGYQTHCPAVGVLPSSTRPPIQRVADHQRWHHTITLPVWGHVSGLIVVAMATAGPVEVEQLGDTLPPGERSERALLGGLLEGENTHPIMHPTTGHLMHPHTHLWYLTNTSTFGVPNWSLLLFIHYLQGVPLEFQADLHCYSSIIYKVYLWHPT